jgi:hypothetical protein
MAFQAADPGFEARVRASFGRQPAMKLIGAVLTRTICEFEIVAHKGGKATACALGLETLICLAGRSDAPAG